MFLGEYAGLDFHGQQQLFAEPPVHSPRSFSMYVLPAGYRT